MTRKTLLFTLACALSLNAHAAAQRNKTVIDAFISGINTRVNELLSAQTTHARNQNLLILNQMLTALLKEKNPVTACKQVLNNIKRALEYVSARPELDADLIANLEKHYQAMQECPLRQPLQRERRRDHISIIEKYHHLSTPDLVRLAESGNTDAQRALASRAYLAHFSSPGARGGNYAINTPAFQRYTGQRRERGSRGSGRSTEMTVYGTSRTGDGVHLSGSASHNPFLGGGVKSSCLYCTIQ